MIVPISKVQLRQDEDGVWIAKSSLLPGCHAHGRDRGEATLRFQQAAKEHLEALLETAPMNKNLVALVEAARQALGRRLIRPLLDAEGQLPILLLDPALEEEILTTLSPESGQRMLASAATPGTPLVRRLTDSLRQLIGATSAAAIPVLLCPSPARYHVKRWLEPVLPRLAVVAAAEIPPETRLRPVGTVR